MTFEILLSSKKLLFRTKFLDDEWMIKRGYMEKTNKPLLKPKSYVNWNYYRIMQNLAKINFS